VIQGRTFRPFVFLAIITRPTPKTGGDNRAARYITEGNTAPHG